MRIGDVYKLHGEHPMIALVYPQKQTIYFAHNALEHVKRALRVREIKGPIWSVEHKELKGEYQATDIVKLDLREYLFAGMAVVNEKSICAKTLKGGCSNMYDENDKFIYSWKAPEDIFQCEWSSTQDCTEIWKEVTIDVFAQKDCKGASTSQKKTIAFCTPA